MSVEARQLLREDTKQSFADSGYRNALIHKWGPYLKGLPERTEEERYTKGVSAILMENQSGFLQNLAEEMKTTNVGGFTKFIFPVLRRVFPNLIANEIVSVQPGLDLGLLFA